MKITDDGVFKDSKYITGTLKETLVYIAPKVFHSELYDIRADIYSFGIILWDMWYGRQAFAEFFRGPMAVFFCMVDKHFRLEEVEGEMKPPARWKQLMNHSDENPEKRPSAEICNQDLTALSTAVVRPLLLNLPPNV